MTCNILILVKSLSYNIIINILTTNNTEMKFQTSCLSGQPILKVKTKLYIQCIYILVLFSDF